MCEKGIVAMRKIDKKTFCKWLLVIAADLALVLLTCSLMLNVHFSPDSYDIWTTTDNNVDVHLRDGRFITAALYKVLAILGVNVAKTQSVFTLGFMLTVAFLAMGLSYFAMQRMGRDETSTLVAVNAGFLLIFHNAFIAEWYLFPEVMLMYAISVSSAVLAVLAYLHAERIDKKGRKAWSVFVAFLALTIALGTYQVTIGIYVALLLIFAFIDMALSVRERVILAGKGLILGAGGCIVNVAIVKLLTLLHIMEPTYRGANLNVGAVMENIRKIIEKQPEVWSGHGLFPRYVLPIYFVLAVVLLLFFKQRHHLSGSMTALALFFAASTYIGSYIPHFVTSDFWLSQRTLVPMFGAFSLLMIAIISLDSSPKVRYVTEVVIVTFLLGNSVLMESIFSNHLAMDDLDRAYAKAIHASIEKHATQTGIDIDHLAIERDAYPTWSYDGIDYVTYDMNVRNILRSWSNIGLINTANGTDYQPAEMDEGIWAQYFDGKNWNYFSPDEQIVYSGNTAYIVIY